MKRILNYEEFLLQSYLYLIRLQTQVVLNYPSSSNGEWAIFQNALSESKQHSKVLEDDDFAFSFEEEATET